MIFVGTGTAWGIPSPFCNCDVCKKARTFKGKRARSRAMFMLDEQISIDIGPDHLLQSVHCDLDLTKLRHILVTHTHGDHLSGDIFGEKFYPLGNTHIPLQIYLVEDAYRYISESYPKMDIHYWKRLSEENVNPHQMKFNEPFMVNDYKVTAFKGRHKTTIENLSANYLIERNDRKLYYALDSGYFYEETFNNLKDQKLDIYIGELTYPTLKDKLNEESDHMDIKMCVKNLNKLYEINAITNNTKVYLTHIGCEDMDIEEIEAYFASLKLPYEVIIAYDGLDIGEL